MTGRQELIPVTLSAAFVSGAILALLASLQAPLAQRLGLSEQNTGRLLRALNLALLPLLVLGGAVIDGFGVQRSLILCCLLAGVALGILALPRGFLASILGVLMLGMAGAWLGLAACLLMPAALYPDFPAASANLGFVAFGLGTLIAPLLTDFLVRTLELRRSLGLLGLGCLGAAFLAAGTSTALYPERGSAAQNLSELLNVPVFWEAGLLFCFAVPLEGIIGTWAMTYLQTHEFGPHEAGRWYTGYWLVALASRLLTSVVIVSAVLPHGWEPGLLIVLALLSTAAVANLTGAFIRARAAWGLLLLGAVLGPIFPTALGVVLRRPEFEGGPTLGALLAFGALGHLILVALVALARRASSIQRALLIPMGAALCAAGSALLLSLSS